MTYAIQQLNLPNVSMYLDAGHAGWLGWSANIGPAATMFGNLYKSAGSPAAVRGLATNVANYNAWSVTTCAPYTSGDSNCDEKRYINALAPLLTSAGFPAHFIMDTSRNGVQPTAQQAWGDWCNVIGTGFGVRPTTNTGDPLEDAFVWIKPGGECGMFPSRASLLTNYLYYYKKLPNKTQMVLQILPVPDMTPIVDSQMHYSQLLRQELGSKLILHNS